MYIDEVEKIAIDLAKQIFHAEFVDVRPVSGVNSNLIAYTAFTSPGDIALALSIPNGGHISYGRLELGGTAGAVRGLKIEYFPFDENIMNIDIDATRKKIERLISEGKKPKLAIFGASVFLFPHPVKELEALLHSYGITLMYDGAHVLGLIGGHVFQDPLREGSDVITGSTHKTLPGPQGGIVLSWNKYSELLKRSAFPGNISNHHLHHVAGKAVAFAEFLSFGEDYARAVQENAKTLAEGLASRGMRIFGERVGYTQSHQVLMDVSMYGGGGILEKSLEKANIIVNRNMIPTDIKAGRHFDNPGGLRFGVQEVTRLGMGKNDMDYISELIVSVVTGKKSPEDVSLKVAELRKSYQSIKYAFDTSRTAYEYISLRR